MKHENEAVNAGLVTRIASGLLAVAGIWAVGRSIMRMLAGGLMDWWALLMLVGGAYGIYLFGAYALTGKLPLRNRDG